MGSTYLCVIQSFFLEDLLSDDEGQVAAVVLLLAAADPGRLLGLAKYQVRKLDADVALGSALGVGLRSASVCEGLSKTKYLRPCDFHTNLSVHVCEVCE